MQSFDPCSDDGFYGVQGMVQYWNETRADAKRYYWPLCRDNDVWTVLEVLSFLWFNFVVLWYNVAMERFPFLSFR